MSISFSVIMPAYNASLYIKEAIDSVLSQTYPHFELIIIDDGSTDNTFEIVSAYADNRVKIIRQANKGLGGARNAGIHHAQKEYVAFLDSDDIWMPDKLYNIVKNIGGNDIGIYYSNVMEFKDNINQAIPNRYTEPISGFQTQDLIKIYDFIVVSSAVVPLKVLTEFNSFVEDLNGTEDWDMWIRIGGKYQFKHINTYDCYYRMNENGLSKKRQEFLQKEYKVIQRHLLSNTNLNRRLVKQSLWVWYKKNFYYHLLNKHPIGALQYFLKMLSSNPLHPANFDFIERAIKKLSQ